MPEWVKVENSDVMIVRIFISMQVSPSGLVIQGSDGDAYISCHVFEEIL